MDSHHPRWNFYDTGYAVVGALICAFIWLTQEPNAALPACLLLVLAYAAGRAAGAHR